MIRLVEDALARRDPIGVRAKRARRAVRALRHHRVGQVFALVTPESSN